MKRHRGGAVLALGICGFAVCPILGLIGFFMGKTDLAEMRAGIMDPSGQGLTQAGYWLGLISGVFGLAWIGLVFLVVLGSTAMH
jgi:hypothetical protein